MKKAQYIAMAISTFLLACGKKESPGGAATTNTTSASTPLTAPADYLGAIVNARDTAIKTVDTANISQAIRMFQVENGRNPKDLDELVQEKYLTAIPAAPYGMKIVYDSASGTVKVVKK